MPEKLINLNRSPTKTKVAESKGCAVYTSLQTILVANFHQSLFMINKQKFTVPMLTKKQTKSSKKVVKNRRKKKKPAIKGQKR